MNKLKNILKEEGYSKANFNYTLTNHIELKVQINEVLGNFIIDTGASNSFINKILIDKFKISSEKNNDAEVIGIGKESPSATLISHNNKVVIEAFEVAEISFALLEMDHVNDALLANNGNPLDGVIGGDFLEQTKAIIDYNEHLVWFKN